MQARVFAGMTPENTCSGPSEIGSSSGNTDSRGNAHGRRAAVRPRSRRWRATGPDSPGRRDGTPPGRGCGGIPGRPIRPWGAVAPSRQSSPGRAAGGHFDLRRELSLRFWIQRRMTLAQIEHARKLETYVAGNAGILAGVLQWWTEELAGKDASAPSPGHGKPPARAVRSRRHAGEVSGEMVGAVRFELTTSCTRNKRATRLRYAPTQGAENCPLRWRKATMNF
jgi:hypothetical protein